MAAIPEGGPPVADEMKSHDVEIEGLRLHYVEAGEGEPVLLLHGWPTSSYLWRHVMPPMARHRRVIALDLPGFGKSDKPLEASYSFRFFEKIMNDFLAELGIDRLGLAVHDLGGPIGLYWAVRQPQRLQSLALLNTLLYPELSWAAKAFVMAMKVPGLRSLGTSPWALEKTMRLGVAQQKGLTAEIIARVQEPFRDGAARRVLAKAGSALSPKGFVDIEQGLEALECPVRVVYGKRDRILPDVAETMARVQKDLPQTEITALSDCGHFLQEDRPDEVGRLLAEFFGA
ncbi:MAG: alpha/beta fold hydrolase [Acidobacteriota bacterium]